MAYIDAQALDGNHHRRRQDDLLGGQDDHSPDVGQATACQNPIFSCPWLARETADSAGKVEDREDAAVRGRREAGREMERVTTRQVVTLDGPRQQAPSETGSRNRESGCWHVRYLPCGSTPFRSCLGDDECARRGQERSRAGQPGSKWLQERKEACFGRQGAVTTAASVTGCQKDGKRHGRTQHPLDKGG